MKKIELQHEALGLIAERFRLLGDVHRLKILLTLKKGAMNVTSLLAEVGTTQANVSRHLQAMTRNGILMRRKEGLSVFYSIAEPKVFELCDCVCKNLQKSFASQAKTMEPLGKHSPFAN